MSNNAAAAVASYPAPTMQDLAASGIGAMAIFGMFGVKVWKEKLSTDDEVSANDLKKIKMIEGVTGGIDMMLYLAFGYALYSQLTKRCQVHPVRKVFFAVFILYFMGDKIASIAQGFGIANKAEEVIALKEEAEAEAETAETAEEELAATKAALADSEDSEEM